jgi:hypothetical protein
LSEPIDQQEQGLALAHEAAVIADVDWTTYFVTTTEVFAMVTDPSLWVRTQATTVDGAKRAATKQARSTTFTARVATQDAKGEFQTIAQMDNSFAITRRRPKWRECRVKGI